MNFVYSEPFIKDVMYTFLCNNLYNDLTMANINDGSNTAGRDQSAVVSFQPLGQRQQESNTRARFQVRHRLVE